MEVTLRTYRKWGNIIQEYLLNFIKKIRELWHQSNVMEVLFQEGSAKNTGLPLPQLQVQDYSVFLGEAGHQNFSSTHFHVTEVLFQSSVAKRSENLSSFLAPNWRLKALYEISILGTNIPCPISLIGWSFYAGNGKLRRPEVIFPAPFPDGKKGCHFSRNRPLSPFLKQWHRGVAQWEKEAIRTKSSVTLPNETDFI